MSRPAAILLMGPTGAGKTERAAELVAQLPLEIVSVDSAMVFRGMDIGTAKPGPELLARVPLLVGGTMLYFRALQSGLATLPAADAGVRMRIEERASRLGWPALHAELRRLDPLAAESIRPTYRPRLQRPREVIELIGGPISPRLREDLRRAAPATDLRLVLAPARREALAAGLAS